MSEFKYQAQYDALNWWHKFLFSQNSHKYIIVWQREEIAELEAKLLAGLDRELGEGR